MQSRASYKAYTPLLATIPSRYGALHHAAVTRCTGNNKKKHKHKLAGPRRYGRPYPSKSWRGKPPKDRRWRSGSPRRQESPVRWRRTTELAPHRGKSPGESFTRRPRRRSLPCWCCGPTRGFCYSLASACDDLKSNTSAQLSEGMRRCRTRPNSA